jgi:hypothetical protein
MTDLRRLVDAARRRLGSAEAGLGVQPDAAPWPYTNTERWAGETVILRAGVSAIETLRRVESDPEFPEILVFSVQSHPGATEEQLLVGDDGRPLFPNSKFRTTTLGAVREKALDPRQCLSESPIEGNANHCNVVGLTPEGFESILSKPPTENRLRRESSRP